jgi:hypothetical protein
VPVSTSTLTAGDFIFTHPSVRLLSPSYVLLAGEAPSVCRYTRVTVRAVLDDGDSHALAPT